MKIGRETCSETDTGCANTKLQDIVTKSLSVLAMFKKLIMLDDALSSRNCNYDTVSIATV